MIVVSDTTPINYLILIDCVDVLPKLFDTVYAPTSVIRELANPRAPQRVQHWTKSLPPWLKVEDPVKRLPSTALLDDAEADAISFAKERGISDILIDEYLGRKVATSEGLATLPTIAVLERAAEKSLLDLRTALDSLEKTSYRVRPEILEAARQRDAARRQKKA